MNQVQEGRKLTMFRKVENEVCLGRQKLTRFKKEGRNELQVGKNDISEGVVNYIQILMHDLRHESLHLNRSQF